MSKIGISPTQNESEIRQFLTEHGIRAIQKKAGYVPLRVKPYPQKSIEKELTIYTHNLHSHLRKIYTKDIDNYTSAVEYPESTHHMMRAYYEMIRVQKSSRYAQHRVFDAMDAKIDENSDYRIENARLK